MFASAVLLGAHRQPSASGEHLAGDLARRLGRACPASRSLMNQAFSAKRQASRKNGTPCRRQMARTPRRFSSETGWPPPELLVIVEHRPGRPRPAVLARAVPSSAARSMLPLNGCATRWLRGPPGSAGRGHARPVPRCWRASCRSGCCWARLARRAPIAANRIRSAARPWCVGMTCRSGIRSCTLSNRNHDGDPA